MIFVIQSKDKASLNQAREKRKLELMKNMAQLRLEVSFTKYELKTHFFNENS